MDKITNKREIAIDASGTIKPHLSGIEHYARLIIRSLISQSNSSDTRFILYSPKSLANILPVSSRVAHRVIPFPRLWSQIRLAIQTIVKPSDVLFVPSHVIPFLTRGRVVTTIHDLGFLHYPSLYPTLNRWYHTLTFRFSVKRASHIIAISEFTKADILKHTPTLDKNKISVIYHGVDTELFRPISSSDYTTYRDKYGPYILFVGRLEYKKNISRIIKAYIQLRKKYPKVLHKLVLAGKPKYGFNRIENLVSHAPANIARDIISIGYVINEQVPKMMREADLFLFPTLFEGFGMPVLEAFASGVPVVTSNTTALPEVAGQAAILVNPYSVTEIANACHEIITIRKLYKTLQAKGFQRVADFTWDKAGRQTLDVLESVARHA